MFTVYTNVSEFTDFLIWLFFKQIVTNWFQFLSEIDSQLISGLLFIIADRNV